MYLLIRYPAGVVIEGVVLAAGENRLRVVSPGFPDTLELERSGESWILADGYTVELEFLMSGVSDTPQVEVPLTGVAYAN
jgi:hypothetical protein